MHKAFGIDTPQLVQESEPIEQKRTRFTPIFPRPTAHGVSDGHSIGIVSNTSDFISYINHFDCYLHAYPHS